MAAREEGLGLMGSDTNLMVKAKIACKSTASQGFSFVRLPKLLIKTLLADTAWRRLYSQGSSHPAGFQSGLPPLHNAR